VVDGRVVGRDEAVEMAADLVAISDRVLVLTGAGVSTDSRIPDYRGPQGVWTRNPAAEKQATLQNYLADPDLRRQQWRRRLDSPIWVAEPNAGHRAITRLEARRKLSLLITQNIDGLHQDAGTSPDRIVEIHGTARRVRCMTCTWTDEMRAALERVRRGEEDPDCPECGGILKSATISFGQNLVAEDLIRAQAAAEAADLLLAIGSTLSVYPIANVVPVAKRHGAAVVIVNGGPTEMDVLADVVVRGSISHVLPPICDPAGRPGPA
jgi:NAD-dependent deacetylase